MTKDLRGNVAIITGASSGIGREVALAFARAGVRTVLAARREERLREVAEAVSALNGEALVVPTNVADQTEVEHLVEATMSRFSGVDILVNNAGYGLFASVEDTTVEDVRRIMEVNFMGAFHAVKAVLPIMRQQGRGHIINVASIVGKRALPYSSAYCATKSAMISLSESLRVELAGSGIDVSVVCPAGTATEFFEVAENKYNWRARPTGLVQSAAQVAQTIARVARKPKPEVMSLKPARLLVISNAMAPGFVDWGISKVMGRVRPGSAAKKAGATSGS
jgi:hypothetical protein